MKNLEALHPKKYYKNTSAWLDAVYRNNKSIIDQELSSAGKPKVVFKQIVKEYMSEGFAPTNAVKTLARSTIFTPVVERLHTNLKKGLTSDRDAYKTFRELTKENNRYTKFDSQNLKWDRSTKSYIYNEKVRISFRNSPYGIEVSEIDE